jgi:hypothetical protein
MTIDKDLEKYYEERFSMMTTKGWSDLIEDVQNLFDSYNDVGSIDTVEKFQKRKGQLDILKWILTLKDVSEQTYEELQNEETI